MENRISIDMTDIVYNIVHNRRTVHLNFCNIIINRCISYIERTFEGNKKFHSLNYLKAFRKQFIIRLVSILFSVIQSITIPVKKPCLST